MTLKRKRRKKKLDDLFFSKKMKTSTLNIRSIIAN